MVNGLDALVLEVEGYGGLPALFEYEADGVQVGALTATFFTEDCQLQESFGAEQGEAVPIVIPQNAHWLLIGGAHGATNIQVKMESEGKKCKKKKKKKKKGRQNKNRASIVPTLENSQNAFRVL